MPSQAAITAIILTVVFMISSILVLYLSTITASNIVSDYPFRLVYFFGHWWNSPIEWKCDDSALINDMKEIKRVGFNVIAVDHEISQCMSDGYLNNSCGQNSNFQHKWESDWKLCEREHWAANISGLKLLPWLQLSAGADISKLESTYGVTIKRATNQSGYIDNNVALVTDQSFQLALADYVNDYLSHFINYGTLPIVNDNGQQKYLVGIMVETGWNEFVPYSFDDSTNQQFRNWLQSNYASIGNLNSAWGTSYSSFDSIDPKNNSIFNYSSFPAQKSVQDHARFRAKLLSDVLQNVTSIVESKYPQVTFAIEVPYPPSSPGYDAMRWKYNSANFYELFESSNIPYVIIRHDGCTQFGCGAIYNTSYTSFTIKQDLDELNSLGKKVVIAYRYSKDADKTWTYEAFNDAWGIGIYNWNELADSQTPIFGSITGTWTPRYGWLTPGNTFDTSSSSVPKVFVKNKLDQYLSFQPQ